MEGKARVTEESAVWIKTEPSIDGSTYMVTIEFSDDRSIPMTPDTAPRYAMTILQAVARAEYDAAVYRQLGKLISDQNSVAQLIVDLRKDRPDVDQSATGPLRIEPGVNRDGEPFLHVHIDDELIGQWTMQGAREHALTALEATIEADLDSGYYRSLAGLVGLEEARARQVIEDLANHREEAAS